MKKKDTIQKVLVVHPGKQHAYRVAEALDEIGILSYFVTTCYNKNNTFTHFLYNHTHGNLKKKIGNHYSDKLSEDKVLVVCELMGIFALFLNRYPKFGKMYVWWNQKLNDIFANKIIRLIKKHKVDCVISYDFNSHRLFEMMANKTPDVLRVLDVSIVTRPFMKRVFDEDIVRTGDTTLRIKHAGIYDQKILNKCVKELQLADYALVPSKIVKRSIEFCGVSDEKIKIVPYGVDCNQFSFIKKQNHVRPLTLLFVGQVNYRKGMHHLLNVMKSYAKEDVILNIAGGFDPESKLYLEYHNQDNVKFLGFVTRDVLSKIYQQSDVFVLPSLGEGFAMVTLEALSCGLPIIVSNMSGANDAIDDGKDGFEIVAGSEDDLKDKIDWFLNNIDKLPEMSQFAREKAEHYTWEHYYRGIQETITSMSKN